MTRQRFAVAVAALGRAPIGKGRVTEVDHRPAGELFDEGARDEVGRQHNLGDVACGFQVAAQLLGLALQIGQADEQFARILNDEVRRGRLPRALLRAEGREIVGQDAGLGIQVRHVPLEAAESRSGSQRLHLALELHAGGWMARGEVECRQPFARALAQLRQRLAGRADRGFLDAVHGALGRRVEGAQAVDLVAEELDADRPPQVGRPDVDDAAPAAELARRFDDCRRLVPQAYPAQKDPVEVESHALANRPHGKAHLAHGQRHLHEPTGGSDGHGGKRGSRRRACPGEQP